MYKLKSYIKEWMVLFIEDADEYLRKGKGRHCCLGDRMYSIPCCASYFEK